MVEFFTKRKAWKPNIEQDDRQQKLSKTLIVFCGREESGTSTVADYFVREMAKAQKVAVIDISESRTFYMRYIYDEKLCDEQMSEALINLKRDVNKPLEYFEDCFLYSARPFTDALDEIDYTWTISKLFLYYNYIVVDMSFAVKEILDMANYICVVAGTDVLKAYKDKIYLQKLCENMENPKGKKSSIYILLNKVANNFANTQLMMELLNNKINDIYYSDMKVEVTEFEQLIFLDKIYKNPLGLVSLGNSRKEKIFKKSIQNLVESFTKKEEQY
jgi:cellulose biosynthesis protein BcsQ